MLKSHAVATPMVTRLSESDRGDELSTEEKSQYRVIVGSVLYLACWTRPDIAFAVSELSRFVSDPVSMALFSFLTEFVGITKSENPEAQMNKFILCYSVDLLQLDDDSEPECSFFLNAL